jgi:hypothetical protein
MFLKNSHTFPINSCIVIHFWTQHVKKIIFKFRRYISTFTLFWSSFILWFQHSSCWLVGWPQLISDSWRSVDQHQRMISWFSTDDRLTISWRSTDDQLTISWAIPQHISFLFGS